MGRLLIVFFLLALFIGLPLLCAILLSRRDVRRGMNYRQVVMEDSIQLNARENYVLLDQTIGFLERMLVADEMYPLFRSTQQREEAKALVYQFNQKQLSK